MHPATNVLDIRLADTPQDAPKYHAKEYKAANLKQVVVVGKGTRDGNPTVDFVFEDEKGQKYIAMLTGALVENMTAAVKGMRTRTGASS